MIEEFSGGYYRTKMTVQPFDSGPAIEQGLHDYINDDFYSQTNVPVTMRVGLKGAGIHFRPEPEGAMPTDVLGLPRPLLQSMNVHPSAEKVNVLILKPAHAMLYAQGDSLEERLSNTNISDKTLEQEDKDFFNIE
jgi:hypothetical protein